ncbi:PDR/VanB family oxidoreductase [Leekyejoonella antrihumi]|uniref:Oxidoreductase n=1 Tax=Leekyejoonella antrihumi TaxID=1660198 RepID=A0A563DWN0_9MICO|nr:PDR/VanB family oxidoreductase [Leekyejoonella antrihumi]TWP34680.1 oxidoreductase [Leekyejoonella antrihumi]
MTEARQLRVAQMTWEAEGVLSVRLADPAGAPLPGWEPGAHLALHLPGGNIREFSLCSDPNDLTGWTVAVLREPSSRGGSAYVHLQLRVGDLVSVDGPRNNFRLEDAPRYQLIAGGIGITPILAMARELESRGADWSMLYAGRSGQTMAFVDELRCLAPGRVRIHADDSAGGPPALSEVLEDNDTRTLVYCCGPEPLITGVEQALTDPQMLRIERFKAPEPIAPPAGGDQPFDIICAGSGARVHVPVDTTALAALEDAGCDVPSSCTEGICGTCETKVLAGTVDHRDFLLSDSEKEAGDTMFICVSRALTAELTLDIS